ncbi:MAG TPA: sigma-54 dependent transcriptional regulator [Gemmatimonadota bacterium]|nr:sigma-54 dependent transcriptional regulator [Gemmatimonadota bacterium]
MSTILISTDDLEIAGSLQAAFEPVDQVRFVSAEFDVREMLRSGDIDGCALILTGNVHDRSALSLAVAAREAGTQIPVVAIVREAGSVTRDWLAELGVDERFVAPVDPDEIALVVRSLIRRKRIQMEIGIVGNSDAIREVVERIAQIAPVGTTVLITGESGTGKELVARGLHKLSPRRGKAFIAVNIAALPETLLESELFGHEKGAFTGASSLRKGMFELANSGTVFLDEIAEMPSGSQTRLLRVLEQREFMRVGGHDYIKVDVRVIAATNRDLRQAVTLNEFRRDLYFRLNVLHIDMPPLRQRRDDIPLLVHEFIREFCREHGRDFKGITPEAMEILVQYDWPGNVRELRNLIESMVVLAPGTVIRPVDIPPDVRRGSRSLPAQPQLRAPVFTAEASNGAPSVPVRLPEMELFFRTLVELKFDVEDLRREFEAYRRRHPELTGAREAGVVEIAETAHATSVEEPLEVDAEPARPGAAPGGDAIVFKPGMSMQELERAAIEATLKSVGGNRRLAAEKLAIGERTLYRKLKEYGIES